MQRNTGDDGLHFSVDGKAKSFDRRVIARGILVIAGILAAQSILLVAMDHPLICECGYIEWWYPDPSGTQTSQHLTDWYSYTHILHGFLFYLLLWLLVPRLSFGTRLMLAIGLEAAWEVVENTPMIIDRYRESALARGYFGDSVINSLTDTAAAAVGFVLARALPVRVSVALLIATELFLAYAIRDNLTLNILQLIYPTEAVSRWQVGG